MGCLFLPLVLALLAWANVAIVRMFKRRHAGWSWWAALVMGWIVGAALGVYGGFYFEYQASPELRVFGAPIPAAFFHWEGLPGEEHWVDFITPAPILNAGSNVVLLALLAACPVGVLFWLQRVIMKQRTTS